METKSCNKCNNEKNITEFYFRKDNQKYRNECKSCMLERNIKYFRNNRDHCKKYENDKYVNDEAYRLAKKLRNRLRNALLRQVTNKK